MAWEIPGWSPQRSLVVEFTDETGEKRKPTEIHNFIEALRDTARQHGFDVSSAGTRETMRKFLKPSPEEAFAFAFSSERYQKE